MARSLSSLFLYLILAGIIIALPVTILLSNKTVISIDTLFNVYAVCLLVSAIQYRWVMRITKSTVITFLYFLFGSAPVILAILLSLNYFIPSGPERNEDHPIEAVNYTAGTIIITFKDSAYKDDPGMRRFEPNEIEKPPKEMIVRYTTREGLLGFPILIRRGIR